MNCYLCNSEKFTKKKGRVRDNSSLEILECDNCGLVFLSDFEHISNDHYENSGMHQEKDIDISSWLESCDADDLRRFNFLKDLILEKVLLDFGCGAGGFLKQAKSYAKDAYGLELEKRMFPYYKKNHLKVFSSLANLNDIRFDLITAFHVVEHLKDPISTLKSLSKFLKKGGELIIEVPNSDDALISVYNNRPFQSFTYWSQHLYLFNTKTMKELINKTGLKLNWIKGVQRYPLSNHLYWLANGMPGGHEKWTFLNNEILNKEYEKTLASINKTDTIIASVSL